MHSHAGAWERENWPCCSPFWRCCGLRPCRAISPSRGERFVSPCSHAPRVGTRNGQRNVCIPTQERGNEKTGPVDPPLALLRATPLSRHLPLKGGEICFSLFPCFRVGTRNGQRNVCIPTQERGNEKLVWPAFVGILITLPLREGRRGQAARRRHPAGRGSLTTCCAIPAASETPFFRQVELASRGTQCAVSL